MDPVGAPAERLLAGRSAVARNAGYNLAGQLLPIVVALAAMPVVVRELGPARFGLLALALTVVGYFSLFDLGLGRAVTRRIAALAVVDDSGRALRAVSGTAVLAHLALGVVGALALALLAAPLARLLVRGDAALAAEAAAMLRLLALGLPAILVMNAQRAVLEGLSRFDLVSLVRAPFAALVFVIPLAGVLLGWSLPPIVGVLSLSRWLAAAAYALATARAALPSPGRFSRTEWRDLLRFGGWVAVSNILIPAVVYLERVVVSVRGGAEQLGYYAAPHELMMKLLVLPAALTTVLYPLFSALTTRDAARVGRGLAGGTRAIAVCFAPVALCAVLFAEPALGLWLGEAYGAQGGPVLRLLATAAYLNALAFVPFVLLEGAGRPDLVTKFHVCELPVYALLLWVLVGTWGILGAATAWLLRVSWMMPMLFALALRTSGTPVRALIDRGALRAVLVGVTALVAAHFWVLRAGQDTVLLMAGIVIPLAHAAAWVWLLDDEDRAWLRRLLRRLRPEPDATHITAPS